MQMDGRRETRFHIRPVVNLEFESLEGGIKRNEREKDKMMAEGKKRRSSRETIIIN